MSTIRSILFACGQPIFPAGWGGAETTIHDLLLALMERGIKTSALGAIPPGEASRVRQRLQSYFESVFEHSRAYRYEVGYSAEIVSSEDWRRNLDSQIERVQPDLILTQAIGWPQVSAAAHEHGTASILYVHGPEVLKIPFPEHAPDKVIFNSAFTREWLADRFPFSGEVLHPPIDLRRYRVTAAGPKGALTMVNPLPVKGGDLLVPLARALPDRHFLAVEGWALPPFLERSLKREPNIEVIPWQHDARTIYARTAVLLMPSVFEPFGRAPVEAAASGIPCITSGVGGLREAVGANGIFIDGSAGIDSWVDAIRQLENNNVYNSYSEKQAAWVQRFDVSRLAPRFLEIANDIFGEHR